MWIPLHRKYNVLNVPNAKLVEALAHADAGNSATKHDHMEVGKKEEKLKIETRRRILRGRRGELSWLSNP